MNIFQKIFGKKEKMEIVKTIANSNYVRPKTRVITTRKIIKIKKSHDCEDCGKHIFCGSFMCRKETQSWGNYFYDYYCLECAKKYKRMNAKIQKKEQYYNNQNAFAELRSKE